MLFRPSLTARCTCYISWQLDLHSLSIVVVLLHPVVVADPGGDEWLFCVVLD